MSMKYYVAICVHLTILQGKEKAYIYFRGTFMVATKTSFYMQFLRAIIYSTSSCIFQFIKHIRIKITADIMLVNSIVTIDNN